ncbi:MAG: PIN domain-containing protein [Chloroflexi bacterium]|jgi:predicted nucleic acid-binding protein|nr:PIN domain-containing protein [Chloroflexota bacterium]
MKYLLDTTVIVDHARDYPPGVEILSRLFEETGDLYTCDIVVSEAFSRGGPQERAAVESLVNALEYVAVDPDGARWAGDQRRAQLEEGRRKSGIGDALIAASAWRLGATVVTRNARDFEAFGIPVLGYGMPLP